MSTDTIADCLTRIRNAQNAGHKTVSVPSSRVSKGITELLKSEGYLLDVEEEQSPDTGRNVLKIFLKYDDNGFPAISEISRVSKPGRRVYSGYGELPRVRSGLGAAIVSTSQGILTDREARKRKIGGEVLASVF